MKQPGGGPALLFEHVVLHGRHAVARFRSAINLFGSMRRMAHVARRRAARRPRRSHHQAARPEGARRDSRQAVDAAAADGGREVPAAHAVAATPPCQEVVWRGDEVDLDKLPIITCWPEDGGPYITFPMVITRTRSAASATSACIACSRSGRTRSRCTGSGTRSARRTGARWRRSGEKMPVVHRARRRSRRRCTRRARRCRRRSTSSSSPDSCGGSRCSSRRRSPAISRCRPTRTSCSRATSIRRKRS